MLEPRDNGIVLWTLRYGDEVRPEDQYFADVKDEKVEPQLKTLVTKLIEERTKEWDPSIVRDPVQDALKDIIASKKKQGGKPPPARRPSRNPRAMWSTSWTRSKRASRLKQQRNPKKGSDGSRLSPLSVVEARPPRSCAPRFSWMRTADFPWPRELCETHELPFQRIFRSVFRHARTLS